MQGAEDSDRFEALYAEFRGLVFTICNSRLGSVEEAEDAVIAVFTLAYRHFAQYRSDLPFKPWISTIAINYCISVLRSRQRQEGLCGALALDSPALPTNPQDLHHLVVSHCLSTLSAAHRSLLLNKFVEGWTLGEIAQAMDSSEWDVRMSLKRAKELFKSCLEANGVNGA